MHTAHSRAPESESAWTENWHAGALPEAFGSLLADLKAGFSGVPDGDWRAGSRAAATAIELHIDKPDLLDGMRHVTRCDGYSRILLHADPAGRYSVLGLVWPPGCVTPIHAHLIWCALGVHSGALEEETFIQWQDGQTAPGALVATRPLRPGQTCCDASDGRFVHRLANRSTGFAMSLHVYGVPWDRVGDGVNRVLATQ